MAQILPSAVWRYRSNILALMYNNIANILQIPIANILPIYCPYFQFLRR